MSDLRLSWMRDEEGVITVCATDENTGRIAEVADFWTRPMRERLGFRREYAKGVQQQLAETLVWNWNGPPGGEADEPVTPEDDDVDLVCVNAHDRCYGGAGGPCPYCERRAAPKPGEELTRLRSENERLRSENKRLREGLKPFSEEAAAWVDHMPDGEPLWISLGPGFDPMPSKISINNLRRARAALAGGGGE